MQNLWKELMAERPAANYLHPFTALSTQDSYDTVRERLLSLKNKGISSVNLLWSGREGENGFVPFDSETYWTRIGWVAEICREQNMTFMMQDAAPFPTGRVEGLLEKKENENLNKLYLGERHLDVKGPNLEGCFLISELMGSVRCTDQEKGFGRARPFSGDKLTAVAAVKRTAKGLCGDTALDLTEQVRNGMLLWAVPEGLWRIFVIFETRNDGGRSHYMDLLNPASVELNIKSIYEPHYEHLKEEIGRTWLGFFYDEAEIGNLWGYCYPVLPGKRRNQEGESMALPWSREAAERWKEIQGEAWRKVLPFLWEKDEENYHRVRYLFMDVISRIVRETYNGRMQRWCRERGLWYIGHNLEDENTHCSLANGPVHYFRMQAHQDAAGIDLIGGQLLPGKDFTQAWYGCPDGDGEFYHYGIAKLASSAAHIDAGKKGRSFCEVFAVYGDIAGSRLRKFVYDHLLVNGINEMIPAPPAIPGAPDEYSRAENDYVNKMCHFMHQARPVIKTAVLYHAEAEWYQGEFQRFQTPAGELARHQISYDVIPADVFTETDFYKTDITKGLTINGNAYEALIIPEAEALPESVRQFTAIAERTGFPVFYCDRKPERVAENGEQWTKAQETEGGISRQEAGEGSRKGCCFPGETVELSRLAAAVSEAITPDILLAGSNPDIRYARFTGEDGEYYFLFNEGKRAELTVSFFCGEKCAAPKVYAMDVMKRRLWKVAAKPDKKAENYSLGSGEGVTCTFTMDEFEARIILISDKEIEEAREPAPLVRRELRTNWRVTLQNGERFETETLSNINGASLYPAYTGKVVYETTADWEEIPQILDLGAVYEICRVFLNGKEAGKAQNTPYTFEIAPYAAVGKNEIRIEVDTGTARDLQKADSFAFGRSMSASVYNSLEPGGMLGPVALYYRKSAAGN